MPRTDLDIPKGSGSVGFAPPEHYIRASKAKESLRDFREFGLLLSSSRMNVQELVQAVPTRSGATPRPLHLGNIYTQARLGSPQIHDGDERGHVGKMNGVNFGRLGWTSGTRGRGRGRGIKRNSLKQCFRINFAAGKLSAPGGCSTCVSLGVHSMQSR